MVFCVHPTFAVGQVRAFTFPFCHNLIQCLQQALYEIFTNYNYRVSCYGSPSAVASCIRNGYTPKGWTDISAPGGLNPVLTSSHASAGIGVEILFLCVMPFVYFAMLAAIEGIISFRRVVNSAYSSLSVAPESSELIKI